MRKLSRKEWEELDEIRKEINEELPEYMQTNHTAGARTYELYAEKFEKNHK